MAANDPSVGVVWARCGRRVLPRAFGRVPVRVGRGAGCPASEVSHVPRGAGTADGAPVEVCGVHDHASRWPPDHAQASSARQCRRRKVVERSGVEAGAGQGADRGHRSEQKRAVAAIDAVSGTPEMQPASYGLWEVTPGPRRTTGPGVRAVRTGLPPTGRPGSAEGDLDFSHRVSDDAEPLVVAEPGGADRSGDRIGYPQHWLL